MIVVRHDYTGLRQAALELLEAEFTQEDLERRAKNIDASDLAQFEKLVPRRTLSPGYYEHVSYLVWLKKMQDAGAGLALTADEVEGLASVKSAYSEFERKHPPCPHCGTLQSWAGSKRCHKCTKEIA